MRIAVDLDSVLADTMIIFCKILNRRHSTRFTPSSFVNWQAWETARIRKEEFFRTLDEAWFEWENIPPVNENIDEKLDQIRKFGAVDVVTGRSLRTVGPAKAWLRAHRVHYDNFVRTASTLAKAKLNYDVFIDDSAELMFLVGSTDDKYGILYTQPWNRYAQNMRRVFRVSDWDQVPKVLGYITHMDK